LKPTQRWPHARFIAAAVPALNLVRLALVGSGLEDDPGLVRSTSRSGDSGELLRGPLLYVAVLVAVTITLWRDSPAGLITWGGGQVIQPGACGTHGEHEAP
jgi:phytol kinase